MKLETALNGLKPRGLVCSLKAQHTKMYFSLWWNVYLEFFNNLARLTVVRKHFEDPFYNATTLRRLHRLVNWLRLCHISLKTARKPNVQQPIVAQPTIGFNYFISKHQGIKWNFIVYFYIAWWRLCPRSSLFEASLAQKMLPTTLNVATFRKSDRTIKMNEQKVARLELNENDGEYRPDIQSLLCACCTLAKRFSQMTNHKQL